MKNKVIALSTIYSALYPTERKGIRIQSKTGQQSKPNGKQASKQQQKQKNKQTKSLTHVSLRHCKPKLNNDFLGRERVFWNWIAMMGAQHRTHTTANGLHILCKYYIIYILAH